MPILDGCHLTPWGQKWSILGHFDPLEGQIEGPTDPFRGPNRLKAETLGNLGQSLTLTKGQFDRWPILWP